MVTSFKHYAQIDGHEGVDGNAIRGAAEDPKKNTDVIAALSSELEGDDKEVAGAIEGDILQGTRKNARDAKSVSENLQKAGYYAVGLLNEYASHVDVFDGTVDKLNARLRENAGSKPTMQAYADALIGTEDLWTQSWNEAKAALRPEYIHAVNLVDDQADEVAVKFNEGPTPENVKALFRAGLIPLDKQSLWPSMKLSDDDKRQAYENAVKNGTLPDFSTMTDDAVEAYISDHPELSTNLVAIMGASQLSPALTSLVRAQARIDAQTINDAIDGDPDAQTINEINQATERLNAINEKISDGGKMTKAEADYIATWTNTVGADNLAKLPETIHTAVEAYAPGGMPQSTKDAIARSAMSPVADAILNYTNKAVQEDGATPSGMVCTPDNPSGQPYPEAIRELVGMRIGEQNGGYRSGEAPTDQASLGSFSTVHNLDKFNGWAELITSASDEVEGGEQFSTDLAHQAITAKQDINAILGSAGGISHSQMSTGGYNDGLSTPAELQALHDKLADDGVSNLLSLASRNEDASANIMLDDSDRKAVLGLNWDDADGASDLIHAATDRDPGGGGDGNTEGGGTERQAQAALAVMKDISQDPDEYNSIMNEKVSDAIVDTGITWRDTFGDDGTNEGTSTHTTDVIGRPLDLKVSMNSDDQQQFLRFIAGTGGTDDDTDPIRFQASVSAYGNDLIEHASKTGGDRPSEDLRSALSWAGNAEGRIHAANVDYACDLYETDSASDEAKMLAANRSVAASKAAANFATAVVATGASAAFPPAAPFLAIARAGTVPIWDGVFEEETVPDFEHLNAAQRTAAIQTGLENAKYESDYRFSTLVGPGYEDDPRLGVLYEADGTLKPLAQIKDDGNTERLTSLAKTFEDGYNRGHGNGDEISIHESYGESYQTHYGSAAVDADRHDTNGWRSDEESVNWLYGDNAQAREDAKNHLKFHPDDPREPYQPGREQVTDDAFHPAK